MSRNKEYYRQLGRKGGLATVAKHGRRHMSQIGRRGFEATTELYFDGDEELHKRFLARMGQHVYWVSTSIPMKWTRNGRPLWPERMPVHPAHVDGPAPQQLALFDWQPDGNEDLPW